MRIIALPPVDPQKEAELTERLVSAVAEEVLWLYGASGRLDKAGARRHLERIVAQARLEAKQTKFVVVPTNPKCDGASAPAVRSASGPDRRRKRSRRKEGACSLSTR